MLYDYLNYVMYVVAIVGYGACVGSYVMGKVSASSEQDAELVEWSELDVAPTSEDDGEGLEFREELSSVAVDYSAMTFKELKQVCRDHGLKGWSALRKAELVEFITEVLG